MWSPESLLQHQEEECEGMMGPAYLLGPYLPREDLQLPLIGRL